MVAVVKFNWIVSRGFRTPEQSLDMARSLLDEVVKESRGSVRHLIFIKQDSGLSFRLYACGCEFTGTVEVSSTHIVFSGIAPRCALFVNRGISQNIARIGNGVNKREQAEIISARFSESVPAVPEAFLVA